MRYLSDFYWLTSRKSSLSTLPRVTGSTQRRPTHSRARLRRVSFIVSTARPSVDSGWISLYTFLIVLCHVCWTRLNVYTYLTCLKRVKWHDIKPRGTCEKSFSQITRLCAWICSEKYYIVVFLHSLLGFKFNRAYRLVRWKEKEVYGLSRDLDIISVF